ncbi:MAG: hypothetical protein M3Z28_08220 [Candidatus Dormibacteraeota bacterium]|nr:hypothetical protein [Candidatus Dormibacteraeota bacterium]
MNAFQRLVDLRPRTRLGKQAPSEWGKLEWFEVEEAPHLWRVFLACGQKFLVSLPVPPGQKPEVFTGAPLPPASEEAWLGQLHFMVRSDRVLETPLHQPELMFKASAQPMLRCMSASAAGQTGVGVALRRLRNPEALGVIPGGRVPCRHENGFRRRG